MVDVPDNIRAEQSALGQQSTVDFDPSEIVVKCVFADGTTQNSDCEDMEFYAGARGMAEKKI